MALRFKLDENITLDATTLLGEDWAQIFYQLGLGVAAIKVLRQ
jgi:hypothetical protein